MRRQERIEALEIAKSKQIEVVVCWWNPFQNVQWKVLNSRKKLTNDQYFYLSNNGLLKKVSEPDPGKKVILSISDKGIEKLSSLKSSIKKRGVQ
jgi:predicted kinase